MTETGDWTVVQEDQTQTAITTDPSTAMPTKTTSKAAVRFPCMEQPPRYALRSASRGIYLGGTKKGRLVGRKNRTEHDEWTIALVGEQTGTNTSIATLHNHKHGNILSMVLSDNTDLGRTAACVKAPETHDLGLGEEPQESADSAESLPGDEDTDDFILPTTANREDVQWCVIRCSEDNPNAPNGGVTIVSTKTGDCLSVSQSGQIILSPYEPFHVWELECITGELCFLSNPRVDARLRCDMAGLLTLSPNWKGWEVVRITEASNPHSGVDDGYVRISSWMHSQWFLCSDATGTVGTCSVAESLLAPSSSDSDPEKPYRCSKWAIEKYPTDPNSEHEGLILRSVTHGRLLSIHDGLLKTFDSMDEMREAAHSEFVNTAAATTDETIPTATDTIDNTTPDANLGTMVKHHAGEMMRKTDEIKRRGSNWWKQSLTNVQKAVSDTAIQRRNSKLRAEGKMRILPQGHSIPQEETIVWQLESAHLQTYYFISSTSQYTTDNIPARSIGAFPTLTENLRKSDKIQLVRNDASPETLKLYLPEENFYITCTAKGCIQATKHEEDPGTEWSLQEHDSGSAFYNAAHNLYLSFRNEASKTPPAAAFEPNTEESNNTLEVNDDDDDEVRRAKEMAQAVAKRGTGGNARQVKRATSRATSESQRNDNKLKNALENIKLPHQKPKAPIAELCATETPTVWNLEPCTPRAISSKRLKTFAIGTSIAVGTTIAMPFAIAGVAAAMGALGAEAGIGFGIVAAAATGAEAIASVGAIGATAYFCFKPEQNSLTDELGDSKKNQNPWSKRPFANWRKW